MFLNDYIKPTAVAKSLEQGLLNNGLSIPFQLTVQTMN